MAVGVGDVVGGCAAEAVVGGAAAAEYAAVAFGVVFGGVDRGAGFVGGVDVGDLHAPGAAVEVGGDDFGFVGGGADYGGDAGKFGGAHQILAVVDGDGTVFVVQQRPVEAEAAEHFDYRGGGEGDHYSENGLALLQFCFQRVLAHRSSLAGWITGWGGSRDCGAGRLAACLLPEYTMRQFPCRRVLGRRADIMGIIRRGMGGAPAGGW